MTLMSLSFNENENMQCSQWAYLQWVNDSNESSRFTDSNIQYTLCSEEQSRNLIWTQEMCIFYFVI